MPDPGRYITPQISSLPSDDKHATVCECVFSKGNDIAEAVMVRPEPLTSYRVTAVHPELQKLFQENKVVRLTVWCDSVETLQFMFEEPRTFQALSENTSLIQIYASSEVNRFWGLPCFFAPTKVGDICLRNFELWCAQVYASNHIAHEELVRLDKLFPGGWSSDEEDILATLQESTAAMFARLREIMGGTDTPSCVKEKTRQILTACEARGLAAELPFGCTRTL